jgi:hypothetical protein
MEIYHEHVFYNYTPGLFFRFDVAGAGASLKRYSDPSFFKTEHSSNMIDLDVIMEQKPHRIKVSKKGSIIAKILVKPEELQIFWSSYKRRRRIALDTLRLCLPDDFPDRKNMKLVDASCFSCYSYNYFNLVIPMMVIMLA